MTERRRVHESSKRDLQDARRNRRAWDTDSDAYQRKHGRYLEGDKALAWGIWRIPERELEVLGSVRGKRILELGCGAARWSIGLKAAGALPVGLDNSSRQLEHAKINIQTSRAVVPLVQSAGEYLPFREDAFDIVFCDYGAMSFADPYRTVPEVARVLGSGGLLAFSTTTPLLFMCWSPDDDHVSKQLHRPYFGLHRGEWPADDTVDFQLPYGEWIRLFRTNDLVIEDLIEVQPPTGARSSFPGRPLRWSRRWPAEMIWKVRKR